MRTVTLFLFVGWIACAKPIEPIRATFKVEGMSIQNDML